MAGTYQPVFLHTKGRLLEGDLHIPPAAGGVVLFAHGSGSSRASPRNQYVAGVLQRAGLATLLMDLLEEGEARERRNVFAIDLLAERLDAGVEWLRGTSWAKDLPLGLFGASTGAAAALSLAARRPEAVKAVVSRGGRPDLAWDDLPRVQAPTLLIVGSQDIEVLELNRAAAQQFTCRREVKVIQDATHLFPEPGALEKAAELACAWFLEEFARPERPCRGACHVSQS